MSSDLLAALAPWLAAGAVDVYVALGSWPRPRWWQCFLEIALLALAGRSQWRLARGWLRTPLLAPAVMVFFASTIYAPKPLYQLFPFLFGLVVALLWMVRFVGTRARVSPLLGVLLAVLVVVGARFVDAVALERPQVAAAHSILEDFTWPLRQVSAVTAASEDPPVIVLSVDTLRADAAGEMETVRRLKARGAIWERAMSTSSWTLPALASLQTGKMPNEHGAGCLEGGQCQGMFPGVRSLAEDLEADGYATAAVVSNPWVTGGTGFDRGFDTFIEPGNTINRLLVAGLPAGPQRQDAQHVVDAALDWLARAPMRGFYLWVHVFDPHLPYLHATEPAFRSLTAERLRTSIPLTADERRALRAAYDGEVAYTDRQLLRLLDAVARRGTLDDGVVVFTADHGEEFWEHGGVEHGHSHHGEVVDVPLILIAPGVTAGHRKGVASLIDVASTIRAAVGLAPGGIDLRREVPAERIATAWGGVVMHIDCSARDAQRRAIARDCSNAAGEMQVFDLQSDPGELRPLPAEPEDPVVRAALGVRAPHEGPVAQVNREALRQLGYVK
jgi:arylsulfatase A-like enzyme